MAHESVNIQLYSVDSLKTKLDTAWLSPHSKAAAGSAQEIIDPCEVIIATLKANQDLFKHLYLPFEVSPYDTLRTMAVRMPTPDVVSFMLSLNICMSVPWLSRCYSSCGRCRAWGHFTSASCPVSRRVWTEDWYPKSPDLTTVVFEVGPLSRFWKEVILCLTLDFLALLRHGMTAPQGISFSAAPECYATVCARLCTRGEFIGWSSLCGCILCVP